MNSELLKRLYRSRRIELLLLAVLAVALALPTGYTIWVYTSWQNKMIEWDCDTIQRQYGGATEEDRLLDIRFIKQWEYQALKKTSAGTEVWLHFKLSKRHCGNLILVDTSQRALIRPVEMRFPDGESLREAFSCSGAPNYESAFLNRVNVAREVQ